MTGAGAGKEVGKDSPSSSSTHQRRGKVGSRGDRYDVDDAYISPDEEEEEEEERERRLLQEFYAAEEAVCCVTRTLTTTPSSSPYSNNNSFQFPIL